jgi:hypothetical protein
MPDAAFSWRMPPAPSARRSHGRTGPVRAAKSALVRTLAHEQEDSGQHVYELSPGPGPVGRHLDEEAGRQASRLNAGPVPGTTPMAGRPIALQ